MEVILLERIEKLGQMGDVVRVKPGYARNYLLPQKKALRKTDENMAYFEGKRAELEAINLKRRQEAEAAAGKLEGTRLIMVRSAGESGQLYGSVAARDIHEALKDEGIKVERRQVELPEVIKQLGAYKVAIRLHPEVVVDIDVVVARSKEEAEEHHTAEEFLEHPEDMEEDVLETLEHPEEMDEGEENA